MSRSITLRSRALFSRLAKSLSTIGLLTGTLFFAASFTPSLIPRTWLLQGALAGLAFGCGYLTGVLSVWLWSYLELPALKGKASRRVKQFAALICTAIALIFLWQAAEWQNSIRILVGMEPENSVYPFRVGLIAILTFAILLGVSRLFRLTLDFIDGRLQGFLPRRIAAVSGVTVATIIFFSLANGVLFRYAVYVADSSFRAADELIEPDTPQPQDPLKTGSSASLLDWDSIGRRGRQYVATAPTKEQISAFLGRQAMEPLRVYVGLRSAKTPEERAQLALEELKRIGAFERSILVLITPTGTGWIDPQAIDTLDYLHGGDVATVAIQYSYLASWLALLVEPEYGGEVSRAMFAEIYGYWSSLPRESRPKLYLYGLSLGALNSQRSNELFEILDNPYQGALWVGPPYSSHLWHSITQRRNPGSPVWLPRFRDGSYVRFTHQENALDIPGAHWGPLRVVYLQYASDAVVFFDPLSVYRQPEWMNQPRGPDVSPQMRWYPIVSFLQLLVDMMTATTTPMGHGHVYAPQHYIDAWIAVTDVQGWSRSEIDRLKAHFAVLMEEP
ncbi:alpha/beta hydrolase [Aquamicrobium segne]|uniref:Alpha/beta hydrolase n=1 Tax=Aquamicrobium segne TaxID=469547 RepID=A0ABW0GUD6_9HYPH